jgi:hypothetical protein
MNHKLIVLVLLIIGIGSLISMCFAESNFAKYDSKMVTICNAQYFPDSKGYGANGPYSLEERKLNMPGQRRKFAVSVFLPEGAKGKLPTIFFLHGYGATDWHWYGNLLRNVVSHGYIIVYAPYKTFMASMEERYAMLWDGFMAAVKHYGSRMDLSRVGFVGHSFGGGATPAIAYKGFIEKGWGNKGRMMFIMAPWYSSQITNQQMNNFPPNVNFMVQVYDKDPMNDHRMAIDLYNHIGKKLKNRSYLLLHSQKHKSCEVIADHNPPNRRNPYSGLKSWGVFRHINAVADYTFTGNNEAAKIFLGRGDSYQEYMGNWSDSSPYVPAEFMDNPIPAQPESFYKFPWSNKKLNGRFSSKQQTRKRKTLLERLKERRNR